MKFNKKTAMLVSFTLGTLLVATTALADIANKSGYGYFSMIRAAKEVKEKQS